eukprot:TRINITY_DN19082_c0_g1_i2.p1 TRINITY_DN19082_c0_g1~~TRINITY_DN19082_c0_g1_i2.p1  ORF type:complete len:816 (-),score=146.55 TRINITY_DN19082_c0_g1_i2:60-2414(-)
MAPIERCNRASSSIIVMPDNNVGVLPMWTGQASSRVVPRTIPQPPSPAHRSIRRRPLPFLQSALQASDVNGGDGQHRIVLPRICPRSGASASRGDTAEAFATGQEDLSLTARCRGRPKYSRSVYLCDAGIFVRPMGPTRKDACVAPSASAVALDTCTAEGQCLRRPASIGPVVPLEYHEVLQGTRTVVVRGEVAKAMADMEEAEFMRAQRRRDSAAVAGRKQRELVRRRRNGYWPKRSPAQLEHSWRTLQGYQQVPLLSLPWITPAEGPRAEETGEMSGTRFTSKNTKLLSWSAVRTTTGTSHACTEDKITDICRAQPVFKNPRESRLRIVRKRGRRRDQTSRIMQERKHTFEAMMEKEKQRLVSGYERYASGTVSLYQSLVDVGIRPDSDVERKELQRIAHAAVAAGEVDFFHYSLIVVADARERLRELRREQLMREFHMYDEDGSGHLDEEECQHILELMLTPNLDKEGIDDMKNMLNEITEELASENGQIDADCFQDLVERAREHYVTIVERRTEAICAEYNLTDKELPHNTDDFILLHESYRNAVTNNEVGLTWDEIGLPLLDYDLYPRGDDELQVLHQIFDTLCNADGGVFTFQKFLVFVGMLRDKHSAQDEQQLLDMFRRLDKDGNQFLSVNEAFSVLSKLGWQPRCREDQVEVSRLLKEAKSDDTDDMCFNEFVTFVRRMRLRLGMSARHRLRLTAEKLGLSKQYTTELRRAFLALDENEEGLLEIHELRAAVDHFFRKNLSAEELGELVDTFSLVGTDCLDLEGFFRFASVVRSMP